MRLPKKIVMLLFLLSFGLMNSQILEGNILDKVTNKPLPSATVYLDGTTISTTTNSEGYFKIDSKGNAKSTLVISYVGYVTSRIENPFQYTKIKTYLEEDLIAMDEVVIGRSPFTRKSMMKVFKEQFLGKSKSGLSCTIANEDDINLYFDIATNTLSASSRSPLKITNAHLGYEVNFDLVDFNIEFRAQSLAGRYIRRSYFSGTTFYRDIAKQGRADKKRKDSYLGSASHLMTTIANESWEKEKFALFLSGFKVNPVTYFASKDTLGVKKVTLINDPIASMPIYKEIKEPFDFKNPPKPEVLRYEDKKVFFNVLFNGKQQSVLDFSEKEFLVDENGNYSPIYGIMFGGHISTLKVGDMLPTNYYETIKDKY